MEKTVLIVDDEAELTQGLMRNLQQEPYRLLSATSGAEALDLLQRTPVSVVITDEQMPGMNGATLVALLRQRYPHIICMMLSGARDFDAAIHAINHGEIYRFLQKPCDPFDVAFAIRLALDQQSLIAQARKLLDQYRKELSMRRGLEKKYPGIFDVERDACGRIVIESAPLEPRRLIAAIEAELKLSSNPPETS